MSYVSSCNGACRFFEELSYQRAEKVVAEDDSGKVAEGLIEVKEMYIESIGVHGKRDMESAEAMHALSYVYIRVCNDEAGRAAVGVEPTREVIWVGLWWCARRRR